MNNQQTAETTSIYQDMYNEGFQTSLMKEAEHLRTKEEKMLFYYSAMTACSSLFPRMSATYNQSKVYANLYLIVSAPPASGKGLMMAARTLLARVHEHFITESRKKHDEYKMKKSTMKLGNVACDYLEKPKYSIVLVPVNCTSSKLYQHLADNSPYVPTAMVDSEIDSLATANKSEHGGFDDIMRKVYHHEAISITRKHNDEFIEVEQPKLSIVLSGTPDQIYKLIGSPSNGLYSRFIFFSFKGKSQWEDV
jgi:hypothetical protein